MKTIKIRMELLSPGILGNGESKNGLVNQEILIDDDGYPMYLGKTFKGMLRQAFDDCLDEYYLNNNETSNIYSEMKNKIFGKSGYLNENSLEENEGNVIFSNLKIESNVREYISQIIYKKSLRLECFSQIRFSTKIEDGLAEDKHLRTHREIMPGTVFEGEITIKDENNAELEKYLRQGLKAIKSIGAKRNKGKGVVKITTIDYQLKRGNELRVITNEEKSTIYYELNLQTPVKIGTSNSSYDYEETQKYISGGAVRGSIINLLEENDEIKELIKKVKFSNAYPIFRGNYGFPTPEIFKESKKSSKIEPERKENLSERILLKEGISESNKFLMYFDKEFYEDFDEDKNKYDREIGVKGNPFSYYEDETKTLYQFDVDVINNIHHSTRLDEENIFRYQALKEGQKFYGRIESTDKNWVENIIKLLESNQNILYVGGSRTTGYGKCLITGGEEFKIEKPDGDKEYAYFYSDGIFKNIDDEKTDSQKLNEIVYCENNEESTDEKDKKTIKIYSTIKKIKIGGYNSKWGCSLPLIEGIKKGSVIKTKKDNFESYLKSREKEGYGEIIWNPKFIDTERIHILSKVDNNVADTTTKIDTAIMDAKLKTRVKEALEDWISKNVVANTLNESKNDKNKFEEKASWRKILDILDEVLAITSVNSDVDLKEILKIKLEEFNRVTQNFDKVTSNYKFLNTTLGKYESTKEVVYVSKLKEIFEGKSNFILNIKNSSKSKEEIDFNEKRVYSELISLEHISLKSVRDYIYYSLRL